MNEKKILFAINVVCKTVYPLLWMEFDLYLSLYKEINSNLLKILTQTGNAEITKGKQKKDALGHKDKQNFLNRITVVQ